MNIFLQFVFVLISNVSRLVFCGIPTNLYLNFTRLHDPSYSPKIRTDLKYSVQTHDANLADDRCFPASYCEEDFSIPANGLYTLNNGVTSPTSWDQASAMYNQTKFYVSPFFHGLNMTANVTIGETLRGQKFAFEPTDAASDFQIFSPKRVVVTATSMDEIEVQFPTYASDKAVYTLPSRTFKVPISLNDGATFNLKDYHKFSDSIKRGFYTHVIGYEPSSIYPDMIRYKITWSFCVFKFKYLPVYDSTIKTMRQSIENTKIYGVMIMVSFKVYSELLNGDLTYYELPYAITSDIENDEHSKTVLINEPYSVLKFWPHENYARLFTSFSVANSYMPLLIYATMYNDLQSFDENCGWGNEAYYGPDLYFIDDFCLKCAPGTWKDNMGSCNCITTGINASIPGISIKKAAVIDSGGSRESNAYIFVRSCTDQLALLEIPGSYCIADLFSKINENTSSVVISSVSNDKDNSMVTVSTEIKTNIVEPPLNECFKHFVGIFLQWLYKPKEYNRLAYDYVKTQALKNIDSKLTYALTTSSIIDKAYLRYDSSDIDNTYLTGDYTFLIGIAQQVPYRYTASTDVETEVDQFIQFIMFNSTLQMIGKEEQTMEQIETYNDSEEENEEDQSVGSAKIVVTDFIESSAATNKLCYGCNLYYENQFTEGKGFFAKICWDESCLRPVRSYRLQVGDIVYLKYASLTKQTTLYLNTPSKKVCEQMPNTNYGQRHEIISLYNKQLSDDECSVNESMFNNIRGGSIKMNQNRQGRYKYQITQDYSTYAKEQGQAIQYIFFEFFIPMDFVHVNTKVKMTNIYGIMSLSVMTITMSIVLISYMYYLTNGFKCCKRQ